MVQRFAKLIFTVAFMLLLSLAVIAIDEPIDAISKDDEMHISSVLAAAVYNIENDTIVYSYKENDVLPTSSFTKMMTAVCAYELLKDRLDETITVEYRMIYDGKTGNYVSGRYIGYHVGEVVTIRDIFGGLLLRGANDSAYLLCYATMGGADDSVEKFVAYMNEKAAALGMNDTVYMNHTGLDAEGMVTSAKDSLVIAKEFYNISFLTEISNSVSYSIPASNKQGKLDIYNENKLEYRAMNDIHDYRDSRIIGMNSGMTPASGNYVASAVCGEELTYIIVVLGGSTEEEKNPAYLLTKELATHALDSYGYVEVIKTSGVVCEVPVRLSTDSDYVTLVPKESFSLYLPYSLDITKDLTYAYRLNSDTLDAPITEGQVVGSYTVSKDGQILGSVDLVTKNSLSRSEFLVVLDSIENFTQSTFFIVTVLAAVFLTVAYLVISAISRHRRRNRHYGRR